MAKRGARIKTENTTDTQDHGHIFSKTDWVAAGLVTLIALAFYCATLAPTVTLEQSGAFVVAGQHLGIGRVPGYPLWHLLAKGFITVFGFVRYRGYPNPAWATNFMSALFGALSCGLVSLFTACLGRAGTKPRTGLSTLPVAAVGAGLLFAVSHTMWSQSVITETHTLTLFCILLFLAASLNWLHHPNRRSAYALSVAFGAGFAQSHIVVLMVPVLIAGLLLVEPRLCREFCLAHVFLWILPGMLLLVDLGKPWLYAAIASSALLGFALPLRLSRFGWTALGMLLIMGTGLAAYGYLPLVSLGGSPMQFGDSRTWVGFVHVFTRGQYERISPTNVFEHPLVFLSQLRWYLELQNRQFFLPAGLLALLPLVRVSRFQGVWLKGWGVFVLTFFMFSVILLIGANPHGDMQDTAIQRMKFIPAFALWSVFMGIGFAMALDWLGRKFTLDKPDKA